MDCNYNKCKGHEESLSHHPSCPYLYDEKDKDYKDCDDIEEEEMQPDEDTFSTIPAKTIKKYTFNPHH